MKKSINDNQLLLHNGKIITFNDEQTEGLSKIRNWLKSKNENYFTLKGYGGTGKSSIIKKIIDEYRGSVIVSAPTHKARKVIENTTGLEGKTLHSLLGLRPDVDLSDFNPNDPQFNPIAIPKIHEYNFVIIDEASMINKELYELIYDTIKGSHNTKVIFIGDPAQIPPVGEKESYVFSNEFSNSHQLTKIERQKDTNPLIFVYDDIRNNLNSYDGGFKRKTEINKYGEGIVFLNEKEEFRKKVMEKFKSNEFKKNSDHSKLIAWRNITVSASNTVIRNELFGNQNDVIVVGDILMGYRTVSKNQYNVIIENSADYRVVEKSELKKNKYDLYGFDVKLREECGNGKFLFKDVFIIDVKNADNLHNYAERHDRLRDEAKLHKNLWNLYYKFRAANLLMQNITTYRDNKKRSSYDMISKDLDYGFAITAHKCQGSTYDHVFIMLDDIQLNQNIKERNQILYVALTRPSKTATILSNKID